MTCVGEGNALFAFTFWLTTGLNSSSGDGETAALALVLAFALTGATPPAGIPSSPFPVGDWPGWTGWLFGSAAKLCGVWLALVFVPDSVFLVKR
jgi:hypothetical protein